MTLEELAMAAYTAYGDYREWVCHECEMSAWVNLSADERGAWMAAASRVAEQVTKEETP